MGLAAVGFRSFGCEPVFFFFIFFSMGRLAKGCAPSEPTRMYDTTSLGFFFGSLHGLHRLIVSFLRMLMGHLGLLMACPMVVFPMMLGSRPVCLRGGVVMLCCFIVFIFRHGKDLPINTYDGDSYPRGWESEMENMFPYLQATVGDGTW